MITFHNDKPPLLEKIITGIGLIAFIALICLAFSSCSGSRKMAKSETKYDSTSVAKTVVKKDSVVNQVKITNTNVEVQKNVQTKDDYEETITRYYGQGNGNIPTIQKEVINRKGIKTKQDNSKKKTDIDVKDDTKINVQNNTKEEHKQEVSKKEKDKVANAEFELSGGKLFLGIGIVLGVAILAYFVYRRFKRKVKEAITEPFKNDETMDGDS